MSEEEKAELDNKKRLTQQSLLMMNLYNLSALNRDLYTKGQGKYKNFVCLEDDNPEIFMSKLMGVNMLGPSRMNVSCASVVSKWPPCAITPGKDLSIDDSCN